MARPKATPKMRANRHIPFAASNQRWAVLWVKPEKGDYTIIRKDFGTDLDGAVDLYTRANAAGKRVVTLLSCNVGHPPRWELLPFDKMKKVKVKRKGKIKTVNRVVRVDPMRSRNRKGHFWCPYCRTLRRFQQQAGFYLEDKYVPDPGIYCPICGISGKDFHVRKHNPVAQRMWLARKGNKRRRR